MRPLPHARSPEPNEEDRVHAFPELDRRELGAYFTPAPLVDWVLERVSAHVPLRAALAVVDPACGAGAFLAGASKRFGDASLFGLELSPQVAASTRDRLPRAAVEVGNALTGGLAPLLNRVPASAFELWVGNPPWNGTSPLLRSPEDYARARALLPSRFQLPAGTSLRDDFAFFLLTAAARLARRNSGLVAFLTPASLLDAFLYAPLRQALLDSLTLLEVTDLGPGQFRHARVRTCLTIWSAERLEGLPSLAVFRRVFAPLPCPLPAAEPLTPVAPAFVLSPIHAEAERLEQQWRERGEPLTTLVPVSFPGLKTRFDELLVDSDPERLFARVEAFLAATPSELPAFAHRHSLDARCLRKLEALKAFIAPGTHAKRSCLRPFIRYAGARHRGEVPESAWAYCYLDRAVIPRGDHRLRLVRGGAIYDPHAVASKLLFNIRERPLSAAWVSRAGCVHAHRHARFAPLLVPRALRDGEGEVDLEDLVLNLSPAGERVAAKLGGPDEVFAAICRFINSAPVQDVWVPAFATHSILPIPLDALGCEWPSGQAGDGSFEHR